MYSATNATAISMDTGKVYRRTDGRLGQTGQTDRRTKTDIFRGFTFYTGYSWTSGKHSFGFYSQYESADDS